MIKAHNGAVSDADMGLYDGCRNQAEYGGRCSTVWALKRAGLVDLDGEVTDAGREALANSITNSWKRRSK